MRHFFAIVLNFPLKYAIRAIKKVRKNWVYLLIYLFIYGLFKDFLCVSDIRELHCVVIALLTNVG
jgi:hypothetical protein